jgi:hypothetical protein
MCMLMNYLNGPDMTVVMCNYNLSSCYYFNNTGIYINYEAIGFSIDVCTNQPALVLFVQNTDIIRMRTFKQL